MHGARASKAAGECGAWPGRSGRAWLRAWSFGHDGTSSLRRRIEGENRGDGGEAHCKLDGEVGEVGDGPEWRESTTDNDDVHDEDGGDGECTGRLHSS